MRLPRLSDVALWRNRDYMLLWSGQVVSTLGSAASSIIYPLLILALTDSPEAAGIAGALRAIPYLVLSLPVGALIDRWDRKRVMILCDVGRALTAASIPVAMGLGVLTLWQIYLATLIEGSLFVLFNIAEVAALPRIVSAHQLPQAAAQNEAGFGVANIVGPSFGTMLYQAFGRAVPFIADALSYVVSVASLLRIRTPFRVAPSPARRNLRVEIAEGLRWVWSNPLIRYMAVLTGGLNLINAAFPLIVIVLAKRLGAGDVEIGVIFSIGGIGGVIGSLVGGQIQRRFTFGQVIVAVVWLEALLFPLYAIAPSYLLLGVIAGLIFVLGPVYNVVQFSYRLSIIPDELQGRVNSTFRLIAFGFMPVGAWLSGVLIERFGARSAVLLFATWLLVLAGLTTFNRHVRKARPIAQAAAA
ncbi:MAG: MFS transporter [Betaproteobacteria bacterium]|nr:MFS transporter [Betaproteobacteria bacterium]MDE2208694.1 MFS transporter [Betaproteobacteria bacterium]